MRKNIVFLILTTMLLLVVVNAFPQTAEANVTETNENQIDEAMDNIAETLDAVDEIEVNTLQSNEEIIDSFKQKLKLKIKEKSQIVGNTSETVYQVKQLKENKNNIKDELKRIRSSEVNIPEEELAKLIKQTKNTITQLKQSNYSVGKVGSETFDLIRQFNKKDLRAVKIQVQTLIDVQNERIQMLQTLNEDLSELYVTLQNI